MGMNIIFKMILMAAPAATLQITILTFSIEYRACMPMTPVIETNNIKVASQYKTGIDGRKFSPQKRIMSGCAKTIIPAMIGNAKPMTSRRVFFIILANSSIRPVS